MIDLAGIGACLTGVGTLIMAVKIHNKIQTGNGKTIGQMAANAEPHHHRDNDPE